MIKAMDLTLGNLPNSASRLAHARSILKSLLRRPLGWCLAPFGLLVFIAVRIIDLYRPVRIGTLNAKGRISIMIGYVEPYLRKLDLEGKRNQTRVIVVNPGRTANEQIARMYRRQVYLLDDNRRLLRRLFLVTYEWFVRKTRLDAQLRAGITTGFEKTWNDASPAVAFTQEEESRGRQVRAEMGVAPDSQFMCFCTREASFYEKLHGDWPDWDWEDTFHRNSDIEDYIPAARYCASQGLYALRVGAVVDRPLPPQPDKRIIDYATHFRSDFGDIYLGAGCKFAVTGVASFWIIASTFNRPGVWANLIPISYRPVRHGDLFICKKLWSIERKGFLTFQEMINAGIRYEWKQNCESDGIEVINNTPEEISAVVKEMNERLDGTWVTKEIDEELQRRFQALYRPEHCSFGFRSRVGAEFLRQHQDLLGEPGVV